MREEFKYLDFMWIFHMSNITESKASIASLRNVC